MIKQGERIKIDPFNNVGASSIATTVFRPPFGLSVHAIVFARGGTFTAAHMTTIKVKAGGKTLFDLSGTQLELQTAYAGHVIDSAYTVLPFGDDLANTERGMHIGDFDTSVYKSDLVIEVTIGGATSPTLEAYAIVGPPKAQMGLGYAPGEVVMHRALIESTLSPNAAVTNKAYSIGLGSEAGALLSRIFFHHANLTVLDVKESGRNVYEEIPLALNSFLEQDYYGRTTKSGLYVFDPVVNGNYSQARPTVEGGKVVPYQVRLTTSASDTITAYAEVLTSLPRI
jgi:hypothetical protein